VVRLRTGESTIELVRPSGVTKLQWLRQITTAARAGLPEHLEAPLIFGGSQGDPAELEGKVVVQLAAGGGGGRRGGGGAPAARTGAAAILSIDATGGPEPARWPVA